MTCTREELKDSAANQGWVAIDNTDRYVDIYRAEPYSIMVHFTRDGMIIDAQLFTDPPDARLKLAPRIVAAVDKHNANKQRRIRAWMYDHKQSA